MKTSRHTGAPPRVDRKRLVMPICSGWREKRSSSTGWNFSTTPPMMALTSSSAAGSCTATKYQCCILTAEGAVAPAARISFKSSMETGSGLYFRMLRRVSRASIVSMVCSFLTCGGPPRSSYHSSGSAP